MCQYGVIFIFIGANINGMNGDILEKGNYLVLIGKSNDIRGES
jgi:hypothetical protein